MFVVIEMDHVPFFRLVAGFTFLAIPSAMHVLQLMAISADSRYAFVTLTSMASLTGDFFVRAG